VPGAIFLSAQGPVTRADFMSVVDAVGVGSGDTVMVHSQLYSIGSLAGIQDRKVLTSELVGALIELLGPDGTLILPTFTFSFCRTGIYDPARTPSEMGTLTEEGRKLAGFVRTLHPIYSVAAIGRNASSCFQAPTASCFGTNSFFSYLHALGSTTGRVKFLSIGVELPPTVFTHIHHVEECVGVPYRYQKKFEGVLERNGTKLPIATQFYVRDLSVSVEFAGEACWNLWCEAGIASTRQFGNSLVCAVSERDLFEVTASAIQHQADFLCRNGYKGARSDV
jgi:aminoglycoside 3-N-acetyltransferase